MKIDQEIALDGVFVPLEAPEMASQVTREWSAIQQFPVATQTKLLELLAKLRNDDISTLTMLVMGKGGVGKSSTVNSILGERVASVSAFQSNCIGSNHMIIGDFLAKSVEGSPNITSKGFLKCEELNKSIPLESRSRNSQGAPTE
ncbi:hypothetical protein QJS10_CPB11g01881 [Acorus calamus]|uniref:AIG1-type G domain-containing protein n=1 Tax=Acorus calamus TaxID=4465 RepID=A0AAV9DTM9_ACOCL|nr:hypothetical protein QJS10_CPB11g01881 [Acorus calamus]